MVRTAAGNGPAAKKDLQRSRQKIHQTNLRNSLSWEVGQQPNQKGRRAISMRSLHVDYALVGHACLDIYAFGMFEPRSENRSIAPFEIPAVLELRGVIDSTLRRTGDLNALPNNLCAGRR
jgi:hypothetical protein